MMGKLRYQIISIQLCETKVQARGCKMANQVRKNDIEQIYDQVTLYTLTSVNMQIFHTVPYTFSMLLTRRIYVTIKSFSSSRSFILFY